MSNTRTGAVTRRHRHQTIFRNAVVGGLGVVFAIPLYAMIEFSTRAPGGGHTLDAWRAIATEPGLADAIRISAELAVITSAGVALLLAPTMIWVRLRVPRARRTLEFLALLPLTIPAIVLVVGLAPVYLWVTYYLGSSSLTLAFAYIVLALPYAYRAIDTGLMSIDIKTLAEAARSLGAGWMTVIFRVIMPNLGGAMLNATLLTVSLVIGEFTIASLLSFRTLQTEIFTLGQLNATLSIAVASASLFFSFLLLFVLSVIAGRLGTSATKR
jgi:putative spermidine/putrescine transport system permease protein